MVEVLGGTAKLMSHPTEEILASRAVEHLLTTFRSSTAEVTNGGVVVDTAEGELTDVSLIVEAPVTSLSAEGELEGISVEVGDGHGGGGQGEVQLAEGADVGGGGGDGESDAAADLRSRSEALEHFVFIFFFFFRDFFRLLKKHYCLCVWSDESIRILFASNSLEVFKNSFLIFNVVAST